MFIVNGQYYIKIKFGEYDYPFQMGAFEEVCIIQNRQMMLPTMSMSVRDNIAQFSEAAPPMDGQKITVLMGHAQEEEEAKEYVFRVFGAPKSVPSPGGMKHIIKGILDAPKYLSTIVNKAYKGTSSEAIKNIAQEAELEAECDNTSDEMAWLPSRKSLGAFARFICDHGYVDSQSVMDLCVRADKKLLYKNLTTLFKNKAKNVFFYGDPPKSASENPIPCMQHMNTSPSGASNMSIGYGAHFMREKMDGSFHEVKDLEAAKQSSFLAMNKEVKGKVERARSVLAPIDCGNQHDKFLEAINQNVRGRSIYATNMDVLINDVSNNELFDMANLFIQDIADQKAVSSKNGKYCITAKTMIVRGNLYYERLRLTTQGPQSDPQGDLI